MDIKLDLLNPQIDDNLLPNEFEQRLRLCKLCIMENADSEDEYIYSIWIEYGDSYENTLMFDVKMQYLELFASSLLKSIEIVRRDYAEEIVKKRKKGLPI